MPPEQRRRRAKGARGVAKKTALAAYSLGAAAHSVGGEHSGSRSGGRAHSACSSDRGGEHSGGDVSDRDCVFCCGADCAFFAARAFEFALPVTVRVATGVPHALAWMCGHVVLRALSPALVRLARGSMPE